jgi:hypothetical protein
MCGLHLLMLVLFFKVFVNLGSAFGFLCLVRLVAFMRACLRVAASAKAGGQKTFLLKFSLPARSRFGKGRRGLERLFTHNVKLYNCAVGLVRNNPELQYEA